MIWHQWDNFESSTLTSFCVVYGIKVLVMIIAEASNSTAGYSGLSVLVSHSTTLVLPSPFK